MWNWIKETFYKICLYLAVALFVVLRVLNLLEKPPKEATGPIPIIHYFPIISWSKVARVAGLILIIMLFLSGMPMEIESVIALLTWAGGEGAYRFRQYREESSDDTSTTDIPDDQKAG